VGNRIRHRSFQRGRVHAETRRSGGAERSRIDHDKLLLFQSLTIDVGVPTSKYIPVFRV
jgi:hypothetical protein